MYKQIKVLIKKVGRANILGTLLTISLILVVMLYDVPINQSWSSWTMPLSGKIIVLDPGHGGYDGGAESKDGLQEKGITLDITNMLRDYLQEAGAMVIMTREEDVDLAKINTKGYSRRKVEDLQNRIRLVNQSMGDFFISVHLNSIPSEKWHGAQTFYYPLKEENEKMAKILQEQLVDNLQNTDRVALARRDIAVLKYSEIPSVMVEVGFLSNPKEATLLADSKYQKKIAFAIYQGIIRYYNEEQDLDDEKIESN